MREIKFRAWNKKIPEMATWENILKHCNRFSFLKNPDWIFMQFTGLKDKNGKEIFEGDIVIWFINDHTRTAAVYYDEAAAAFWMGKDKETGFEVINDWLRGEYEVIGNVHENPELLK